MHDTIYVSPAPCRPGRLLVLNSVIGQAVVSFVLAHAVFSVVFSGVGQAVVPVVLSVVLSVGCQAVVSSVRHRANAAPNPSGG